MSAPPPSTNAPSHVLRATFATDRIDEERAFWAGSLGFPMLGSLPDATGAQEGFLVAVGESELGFVPAPAGHPPRHHLALEVDPDALAEASRWLGRSARLVPADDEGGVVVDFPNWVAHSVYAVSPGGHVLELIARHRRAWPARAPGTGALGADDDAGSGGIFDVETVDPDMADRLAADEPRRSGPDLVRGISEVGIVTPDVPALVDRLRDVGLEPWFGDPATGFCAVGDEAGLLICAREWRPWFPTDLPSSPGLVQVVWDDLDLAGTVLVGSACELVPPA